MSVEKIRELREEKRLDRTSGDHFWDYCKSRDRSMGSSGTHSSLGAKCRQRNVIEEVKVGITVEELLDEV